jgi:hypothetical protein
VTTPSRANERSERRPRSPTGEASPPAKSERQVARSIEVPLVHARWRHLGWALFGLIAGLLLVLKLGAVGQVIGAILLAVALRQSYLFGRTLLYDSGSIVVEPEQVVLPRGLCRGKPVTVPIAEVKHAFFLRRAVPWTRTAPLLIIEAGGRVHVYPRDWFLSEGDQVRIVRTIRHHLGQEAP